MNRDTLAMALILIMTNAITFYSASQIAKKEAPPTHRELFNAIARYESGGVDNAVGLAGERGRYQILRIFHQDGLENTPEIGGTYMDVLNPEYAEKIITSYMLRYLGADVWNNLTDENIRLILRTFNGGPQGPNKRGTYEYGEAVLNILKEKKS